MAFRAASHLKSTATRLGGTRSFAASVAGEAERTHKKHLPIAEFAPLFGMMVVVAGMAVHTGYMQMRHSPAVSPSKKRRGMMAEVDDPDRVVASADKFINKSWLRHVGQIQDKSKAVLPDTTRPDPFTRPRTAETLKMVGVDVKGN